MASVKKATNFTLGVCMKLYDCRVRLAGLVHHEVPKYSATEKEVVLLRKIHGADAVVGIRSTGESKRTDSEELARLAGIYGQEVVERAFSVALDDLSIIEEEQPEEEVAAEEPKKPKQRRTLADVAAEVAADQE